LNAVIYPYSIGSFISSSARHHWRIDVTKMKRRNAKQKDDFAVSNHGSVILLKPITQDAIKWIERHIGADNGYQPYYPTVILEPRYLDQVIIGIRTGLQTKKACIGTLGRCINYLCDGCHRISSGWFTRLRIHVLRPGSMDAANGAQGLRKAEPHAPTSLGSYGSCY
jgi:hypothetical protein